MHKKNAIHKAIYLVLVCGTIFLGATMGWAADAVNVILKNNSSAAIEVELIDQYGGNFTATIEPGTSQNQALKADTDMKVKDGKTRKVTAEDEGKELMLAGE
jgi:hypothetical protein